MPLYFDVKKAITTNGSAGTLSTHFRAATGAAVAMRIAGLYGAARFGTAGGAQLILVRPGVIGTGGTAQTPTKRNPNFPAPVTSWFDDTTAITAGTSPITHLTVGVAQTGGMGGWVMLEPDHAPHFQPGGGANGNCEVATLANAASVVLAATIETQEL